MRVMLLAHKQPITKSTARLVWVALLTDDDYDFAPEQPISKSLARLVWAALFTFEDQVFCT